MGAPWRDDAEQLLVQGQLVRWGLSILQAPRAPNSSENSYVEPTPTTQRTRPPGAPGGDRPVAQGTRGL